MRTSHYIIILLVSTLLIIGIAFGKILINPNATLFAIGGDGIKNYYTVAYYVQNDSGLHFTGMNYPYGEHIVYTDNQPLLAMTLRWINDNVLNISRDVFGIMNILMITSFLPCVFFLFLILKKMHLPNWYAVLTALIIGFLSPQLARFIAHYALAYVFFLPLTWYLMIRFFEKNNWIGWGMLLIATTSLFGLIHLYYLLLGGVFVLASSVIYLLRYRKRFKQIILFVIFGLVVALLPIILIKSWLFLTDPITDRPMVPWGYLYYVADFETIFLPYKGPILEGWNKIIQYNPTKWEGQAYVGFMGILSAIYLVYRFIRYAIKNKLRRRVLPVVPGNMGIFIWSSILILLFSMGYPFKFHMESLLDYLGPLKQFRSLGRFAWIFYYVFTVFTAVQLHRYIRVYLTHKNKTIGMVLASVFLLFWTFESGVHLNENVQDLAIHKFKGSSNAFLNSSFNYKDILETAGYSTSDFQAILPLPYFLVGSEKFDIQRSTAAAVQSMLASYHTRLPVATGKMSRTSLSQSLKLTQLISHEHIEKQILRDYKNDKPLLLLTTHQTLTA
ncbi:MAG: hypothetical protein IIA45_03940, partial [Bacteroidetes bacterium]|nr:hypothetical protein [Bacteroidota bacterium]